MVSEDSEIEMTTNIMINKLNFVATLFRLIGSRPSEKSVIRHAKCIKENFSVKLLNDMENPRFRQ